MSTRSQNQTTADHEGKYGDDPPLMDDHSIIVHVEICVFILMKIKANQA